MLILLPPSEGKAEAGSGRRLDLDRLSLPELNPRREEVLSALVALSAGPPETALAALGLGAGQHGELRAGRRARGGGGGGRGPVLDLRSGAYAAAWTPRGELAERTLTVRVLHEREVDGVPVRSVVSHFNKATKGRLVRDLLLAGARPRSVAALTTTLRDLKYQVCEQATTPGRPRQVDVIVSEL